jgi:hypothetical protein
MGVIGEQPSMSKQQLCVWFRSEMYSGPFAWRRFPIVTEAYRSTLQSLQVSLLSRSASHNFSTWYGLMK